MASLFRMMLPDVIGSVFIILDFIVDVIFAVHLQKHESLVLFPLSVMVVIITAITVNIVAAMGIDQLREEMLEPKWRNMNLKWMANKNPKTKGILFTLGLFNLLPHVLVGFYYLVSRQIKIRDNDPTSLQLEEFDQRKLTPTIKEIQSVMESGGMVYFKFFYITLYALLYKNNWLLLLGLSLNIASTLFGLRKYLIVGKKLRGIAFSISVINLSMRMVILLYLAYLSAPWAFFIPLLSSMLLLFSWGAWLMTDLPIYPKTFHDLAKPSSPKGIYQNCISSVMYTLFLVPCDTHTAISVIPFTISSIVVACLPQTPYATRILIPFAGTLGLLPPKFFWWIFKVDDDSLQTNIEIGD